MNPKNPTSRHKPEHEDSGHAVCRSWCAACVGGLIVASDYGFMTRKCRHVSNSDVLSQWVWSTRCERKGPTANSISFLGRLIKDLRFRRFILKCDNEPSTKSLQDAVIQACVGVEVIAQGSLEVITWPTVVWKWLYEK